MNAAHEAVPHQEVRRRRSRDHPDRERLQLRVGQRGDIQALVGAIDHHVARVVVGIGRLHEIVARHGADDEVATARLKRIAHKTHHLREPHVADRQFQILTEKLGNLVLEALALFVREGKIVGIRTYAELIRRNEIARLRPQRSAKQHEGEEPEAEDWGMKFGSAWCQSFLQIAL